MKILFIVADSLRPDFLGCYNPECSTPTIDKLASEGVRFETTRSAAPWTVPSIASMMTGKWAHELGLVKWEQPWPTGTKTLFQLLKESDYDISSYVFDEAHLFSQCPDAAVAGSSQDTEKMITQLKENGAENQFTFIHYWWTHIPYISKKMDLKTWNFMCNQMLSLLQENNPKQREKNRQKLIGLYNQAIKYFSETWLPQVLEAANADMVIITADHGESWGERMPDGEFPRDVFDLHGNHLYDEVIKVPWLIYAPSLLKPQVVKGQAKTVDMLPTLLDLLKLPIPEDLAGSSLKSAIKTGEIDKNEAIFARNHDFVDETQLPTTPEEVYIEFGCADNTRKILIENGQNTVKELNLQVDSLEKNYEEKTLNLDDNLHKTLKDSMECAQVGFHDSADYSAMRERLMSLGYL